MKAPLRSILLHRYVYVHCSRKKEKQQLFLVSWMIQRYTILSPNVVFPLPVIPCIVVFSTLSRGQETNIFLVGRMIKLQHYTKRVLKSRKQRLITDKHTEYVSS